VAEDQRFWAQLESTAVDIRVASMAPEETEEVDDDHLDAIAAAFGKVIDAKSPFTAGHSARVADYAEQLGAGLGVLPTRLRRLRRAATLHDVGKLGISSAILEKPGQLDEREWAAMRQTSCVRQMLIISALKCARVWSIREDGCGFTAGSVKINLRSSMRICRMQFLWVDGRESVRRCVRLWIRSTLRRPVE